MDDIDAIIAKHAPADAMRPAIQNKIDSHKQQLARLVADYELERDNPNIPGADEVEPRDEQGRTIREILLAPIVDQIRTQAWAIETLEERLAASDGALHGKRGNRTDRRRVAKAKKKASEAEE